MSKESKEEVTVLRVGMQRQGSSESFEFGEGKFDHLRWTHLEQVQHCTDLPCQVTFPAHTEQGRMGPGLG